MSMWLFLSCVKVKTRIRSDAWLLTASLASVDAAERLEGPGGHWSVVSEAT